MNSARSERPSKMHMNSIPQASVVTAVAALPSTETKIVEGAFAHLPGDYCERVNSRMRELDWLITRGVLTHDILRSGAVVDWEAGDCAFAVALLRMGAPRVFAIDSWLDESLLPPVLFNFPGLFITKTDIHDFAATLASARITIDLVFSNTVTEHIQDLIGSLLTIRRILKPKGYFFTNHDNYYQPVGSHDHGFLFYDDTLTIVPQGVECWNSAEKCAASAEHRESIRKRLSWTWADSLDESRDPRSCERCFYFKRSQPWAHLIYASEFNSLFPTDTFRTGIKNASLNKLTTFQLQQFIRETGFNIRNVSRVQVLNVPPDILLQAPFFFNGDDLRTATIAILAQLHD
jgi:SAM-dependent methyltransferase